MYVCIGAIGLFTVQDLDYLTVIGHVFVCQDYWPFLSLVSWILDSDRSCICVQVRSTFFLSMILSIGQCSVMYLYVAVIGLFSVYDLVYLTVIGHVIVYWGYRPFHCLRSCLQDSDRSFICVLGFSFFFSVYDPVCWTVIGHIFVCWGDRHLVCLGYCLLDSDRSFICVLGLQAFSLSSILSIGQ